MRKPSRKTLGLPKRSGKPRVPYAINDEDRKEILRTLQDGGSRACASALVNIGEGTLHNEIKRNKEFAAEVRRAEAKGEMILVRTVTAGKKGWQGSAFMLERKFGYRRPPMMFAPDAEDERRIIKCRRVVRAITKAAEKQETPPEPAPLPIAQPDADVRAG